MTPDAIPPERLERFGVGPGKLVQYAGLKEEYYLSDFTPDAGALEELGVDREKILVIVRPPPDVSLYHRKSNRLFPRVLEYLGRREDVTAIVIPRTEAQREHVVALSLPSVIVPAHAVDAQSLIALADLAVSAGGTMNREAVALGTPGLHDLRRAARRRRRAADPHRPPAPADRRARDRGGQAARRAHDRAARSGRAAPT